MQQIKAFRYTWSRHRLKFKPSIGMGKKGNISDLNMPQLSVLDGLVWVFQELLNYWGFSHTIISTVNWLYSWKRGDIQWAEVQITSHARLFSDQTEWLTPLRAKEKECAYILMMTSVHLQTLSPCTELLILDIWYWNADHAWVNGSEQSFSRKENETQSTFEKVMKG